MATWESNGHVTVTLSDPDRSKGRDPNTHRGQYLKKRLEIEAMFQMIATSRVQSSYSN